jgi:uncharacterized sulfatase
MRTWLDRDRQGRAHRAAAPPGSKGASRRPNVLLVILDDLSVRLGSYGYPVRTPNIDRLAALGRRFERAYAQVPMCSPSRMTLMTGWGARRLQVWSNATDPWPKAAGATLLQELFRRNGYYTARLGKVYHGRWNRGASWDLSEDDVGSPAPIMEEEPPPEGTVERFWRATDDDDADLPDGRRVRRAAELLSRARDRPFFIAVGIAKPHLRWVAPRKYFDLYSPQGIVLPPEPPDDRQDVPLIAVTNSPLEFPGETLGGIPPDFGERDRRRAIAAHYACVSFADAQVGVLLDALDRSRLWDDTIVVLLGDHGFHLGEHGLWRKDTLFEESVHTPLIVVAPGMPSRGSATRGLVDLTDVYPTLADLAGIPAPAGLEGTSLRPLLDDAGGPGKPAVMSFRRSEAPRLGRSLRTEGYRFTEWPDGSRELYDLASDPGEGVNLAADPRFVATVERLQRLLHAMARRAADVPRRAPRAGGGGGR